MKKFVIKKVIISMIIIFVFSIIYICSFHINFKNIIPVYTYYGIISLFIITILLLIFLFILNKIIHKYYDIKDCFIICLLFFSMNIYFFSMVPVTLERSISVFMLNELDNKKYSKKELEYLFIDKYLFEYDAFKKRIMEQKYTGSIVNDNERYTLSKKGKNMLKIFKIIKKVYNVDGRVLSE